MSWEKVFIIFFICHNINKAVTYLISIVCVYVALIIYKFDNSVHFKNSAKDQRPLSADNSFSDMHDQQLLHRGLGWKVNTHHYYLSKWAEGNPGGHCDRLKCKPIKALISFLCHFSLARWYCSQKWWITFHSPRWYLLTSKQKSTIMRLKRHFLLTSA